MKKTAGPQLARMLAIFLPAILLAGCAFNNAPILNPKGPIALAERNLLLTASALMLIVVIPVFIMAFVFAWRYRASGGKGKYTPDWGYSTFIDAIIWIVPAIIICILGYMVVQSTHALDPYKKLVGKGEPLQVEVVAQDWKWLFIYPEYGIASVNEIAFPNERPLSLRITSDTVMNSFMIPALGGQIYAMAGMTSRLNLIADEPGQFAGRNTMYSGDGFSDQHFVATAMTDEDFKAWTDKVKRSQRSLDAAAYASLAKPSVANDIEYYSGFEPGLFETILAKYAARPAHSSMKSDQ